MKLPFHLGEALESLERATQGLFRQLRCFQQDFDIRELAVRLITTNTNLDPRAQQTAAEHAHPLEFIKAQRQFFQFPEQALERETGVEERCQKHVAADAG